MNRQTIVAPRIHCRFLVLAVSLLLFSCATKVRVTGDYPTALIEPLSYHVGLVLDNNFTSYTFESSEEQDVSMQMGQSQAQLFEQVFGDIFTEKTRLDAVPTPSVLATSNIDLVVVPHLEDIQLAMPFETKLNVFEVWVKYNIQVFDHNGKPISDWLMSAYGKTQTRFLKSPSDALSQATTEALRDAGVRLVVGFQHVPDIKAWIDRQKKLPTKKGEIKNQAITPSSETP